MFRFCIVSRMCPWTHTSEELCVSSILSVHSKCTQVEQHMIELIVIFKGYYLFILGYLMFDEEIVHFEIGEVLK